MANSIRYVNGIGGVLTFFLFFIFFFSFPSFASPPSVLDFWRPVLLADDVYIYELKNNPEVLITFQSNKTKRQLKWEKIKSGSFFSSFEKRKKELLSMISVSQWKAKKHTWTRKKEYFELLVHGSYIDASGTKVSFQEIHLFSPDKTRQILFTKPATIKA